MQNVIPYGCSVSCLIAQNSTGLEFFNSVLCRTSYFLGLYEGQLALNFTTVDASASFPDGVNMLRVSTGCLFFFILEQMH